MKVLFICLIVIIFSGCGTSPDFSQEMQIVSKYSQHDNTAEYVTNQIGYNAILMLARFRAPDTFAYVGDIITFKNGNIIVIENRRKEKERINGN